MSDTYNLDSHRYSTHAIISREIGMNNLVLDIGCYTGYLGKISSDTNTFYGLDFLDEPLRQAEKYYKSVTKYDLNTIEPLPWNIKFDVIVFADVLEHVLYPEKVVDFFTTKYLKEGGIIIISLPNVAQYSVRLSLLLGNFDYTDSGILDKTHLKLYTFKTAQKLAKNCKLQIQKISASASLLGPVIKIIPFTRNILATGIIMTCKIR